MSERIYIHEYIDIIGHQRARYMHHMTANWGPIGRAERHQLCFGVWGVLGSTGQWPQVVNMWEYESWDTLAANFEFEVAAPGLQDSSLSEWWAVAADLRSGGVDRILVAPDWSPSIGELCGADVDRAGYVHEHVRSIPGSAPTLLESLRSERIEPLERHGLSLVGAFRRAMALDDELIAIWSFADWSTWAQVERLYDTAPDHNGAGVAGWFRAPEIISCERILMADAPLSPLRIRRQPEVADRRPLSEL